MTRLDELMEALKTWTATLGRPVRAGIPGDLPEMPWLQLEAEWNNVPTEYGLDGICYLTQHVFLRSFGRDFRDAGWLDDKVRELLCGPVPAYADFILNVRLQPCGTPEVDREGRMHVEHRAAFAYA